MHFKNVLLSSALLCGCALSSTAQTFVPPNMDFETGTTSDWTFYRGTVATGHVYTLSSSSAIPGLHTLMSGSGTDTYGGFPVVGAGSYSLKLAHDTIDNNADRATYAIHVPTGGSYELVYQYAAVLQDAAHSATDLPVFEVIAVDSATGLALPTGALTITSQSSGLTLSSTGTNVYYRGWTTESIDLTGYGGHTVIVKFSVASCGTGAHFGYGYVDVTGVFESARTITTMVPSITMSAPVGYTAYRWTDPTTYMAAHGTTRTITIPTPTTTTTYAVILTPFSGHGTVDTVFTTVTLSSALGTSALPGAKAAISVFPNPTTGTLNIEWANQPTGTANLEIADMTGRVVRSSVVDLATASGSTRLNLSELKDGIYAVTIKSAGINFSSNIVIQK